MSSIGPAEHRTLAIEANNSTWEFLDRESGSLSALDSEEMTRRAYAAAYHWSRAENATVINEIRASWLIAKVWIHQSRGDLALPISIRCIDMCLANNIADFDLAYVYETKARSLACMGDLDGAREAKQCASLVAIADEEDRKLVQADLAKGPWFELS
jgi:hypothetical protein